MYDVVEVLSLFYRCGPRMLKTSQLRKVEAADMNFLLSVKVSTIRDHIRSELKRYKIIIQKCYYYWKSGYKMSRELLITESAVIPSLSSNWAQCPSLAFAYRLH